MSQSYTRPRAITGLDEQTCVLLVAQNVVMDAVVTAAHVKYKAAHCVSVYTD